MNELELSIDHLTLSVVDLARAKAFYLSSLAALELELVAEMTADQTGTVALAAFGKGRKGTLWLAESGQQSPPFHLCFRAKSRAAVRAFYEAALGSGGTDNGAPGVRLEYHPEYYAAFVTSPEGHNIEAVTFELEPV